LRLWIVECTNPRILLEGLSKTTDTVVIVDVLAKVLLPSKYKSETLPLGRARIVFIKYYFDGRQ
jgi:hypothetical protein